MSYISAIKSKDSILVWEREDSTLEGRKLKLYKAPYECFIQDRNGKYKDIYNSPLKKLTFDNGYKFRQEIEEYKRENIPLYESDISPINKILSEFYYDKPAPQLNITFYDIEVDYDPALGFADAKNPYAPINAIALYHTYCDKTVILAVPPDDSWTSINQLDQDLVDAAEIIFFKNEKELLIKLLDEFENSDVISAWNGDFFDDPYISSRIERVLGKSSLKKLSFPDAPAPKFREDENKYGQTSLTVKFSGRINIDYLILFRKFFVSDRHSWSLESVADDFLPDLPKLEYDGSLASLYVNDFNHFIRYNLRDTEILKGLETKFGYMQIASEVYHMNTGLMHDVLGTIRLSENAIINYCHYVCGQRVRNKIAQEKEQFEGAYVIPPKIGLHQYIASVDIASLYPSAIRSVNISPETLIGQFVNDKTDFDALISESEAPLTLVTEDNKSIVKTAKEWKSFLKEHKCTVSGYGTVFNQTQIGIIPAILEEWYNSRKESKKQLNNYKKQYEETGNIVDKEKYEYYDRLQYIKKIQLNSLYGALTNQYFRFYDVRLGWSTTTVGQSVLKHMCKVVAYELDDQYELNSDSIIYGDTDSVYFKTHARNQKEAIVISDVIVNAVNNSFPKFMQDYFLCENKFKTLITAEKEIIADYGIFVEKKRYILHLINLDGYACDKMKVMGLELKKTTIPKAVSIQLTTFVEQLLKGQDWDELSQEIVDYKTDLFNTDDIQRYGMPKGVKNIEKFIKDCKNNTQGKTIPGHVRASIWWNECVQRHGDTESPIIMSGSKIKIYDLKISKRDKTKFKAIAIPGDIKTLPDWFISEFLPRIDKDTQIKKMVDKPLSFILNAIGKEIPTEQSLLANDLLEF